METTVCIRCGKLRILAKTWKEKINGSPVTYKLMVCPDKDCQKIVEEQLEARNEKLRRVQEQSLKRRENLKIKRKPIVKK